MSEMFVYRVYNGYTGFSSVYRIVLAESEDKAIEAAVINGMKRSDRMEAVAVCSVDEAPYAESEDHD